MRKVMVALGIGALILLVLGLYIGFSEAATPTTQEYEVKPGDTLWALSGEYLKDPLKWGEVLGRNPFLKEPGRIFEKNGRTIVLIKPGERLLGLKEIGVTAIEILPISALRLPSSGGVSLPSWGQLYTHPLFWTGLLIFILLVAGFAYTVWLLVLPAVMGPRRRVRVPIVEDGIPPEATASLNARFERIAERRLGQLDPQANLTTQRPQRIGPIERGFLSGRGIVQYRDRSEERTLTRELAYRARFRFPNGSEEESFFLQACANDVTFGGARYTGYTFEPESIVAPVPTAAPPQPQVAVASAPGAAPLTYATWILGRFCITAPQGSMVRVEPDGKYAVVVTAACEVGIAYAQVTTNNLGELVPDAQAPSAAG